MEKIRKLQAMFALSDISEAHKHVKSGADFPVYAHALREIWVTSYETFVSDGHTVYIGNTEPLISPPKYDSLTVAVSPGKEKFLEKLRLHQSGGTDYMTFCRDCAENGIEKWTLDMAAGTCTYYDISENSLYTEHFGK